MSCRIISNKYFIKSNSFFLTHSTLSSSIMFWREKRSRSHFVTLKKLYPWLLKFLYSAFSCCYAQFLDLVRLLELLIAATKFPLYGASERAAKKNSIFYHIFAFDVTWITLIWNVRKEREKDDHNFTYIHDAGVFILPLFTHSWQIKIFQYMKQYMIQISAAYTIVIKFKFDMREEKNLFSPHTTRASFFSLPSFAASSKSVQYGKFLFKNFLINSATHKFQSSLSMRIIIFSSISSPQSLFSLWKTS